MSDACLNRVLLIVDVPPTWCACIERKLDDGNYIARDTDGALWLCQIQMVRREFFDPGPICSGKRPHASVLMPLFGPVTEPLVHHPYARFFDPLIMGRSHESQS